MCWVNNKCIKHVATKDIPIFKLVNKVTAQYCVSLVTLFKYQYEQLYTLDSEIMVEEVYTYYFIYEGFHSYGMNKFTYYKNSTQQLIKGIIPKGATYYYNPSLKEYVSNQIIIKHVFNNK